MSFDERIKKIEKGVSKYEGIGKSSTGRAFKQASPGLDDLKIGAGASVVAFLGMHFFLRDKLDLSRKGVYAVLIGVLSIVAYKAWNAYKKKNP